MLRLTDVETRGVRSRSIFESIVHLKGCRGYIEYLVTEDTAKISLLFTSSDKERQKYEIIMPYVSITAVSASVGGTGALTASIDGEALSSGSEEPLAIVITNTSSTTV